MSENDEKMSYDTNMSWLNRDFQRSNSIEQKISWLFLTHAVLFSIVIGLYNPEVSRLNNFLFVTIPFGLYGCSFYKSIRALSPITFCQGIWDNDKDFKGNNLDLYYRIKENEKEINTQCYRFSQALGAFKNASIYFVISCLVYFSTNGRIPSWIIK